MNEFLLSQVSHVIGKNQTQQLERTNGIIRQHKRLHAAHGCAFVCMSGRWHRRQNKFATAWLKTEGTVRLVVSYYNWIWVHSRKENTAPMRAGLAISPWSWHDLITYPTLC